MYSEPLAVAVREVSGSYIIITLSGDKQERSSFIDLQIALNRISSKKRPGGRTEEERQREVGCRQRMEERGEE